MMIMVNHIQKLETLPKDIVEIFVLLLSPFAPHMAEELWEKLGHSETLAYEPWPTYDPALIQEDTFELVLTVNGKPRDKVEAQLDIPEEEAIKLALDSEKIQAYIEGKEIVKKIYVPKKLVNIVVR